MALKGKIWTAKYGSEADTVFGPERTNRELRVRYESPRGHSSPLAH